MPGKSQIADRIAARGASRTAALAAVDAVLDEITSALAAGERVTLTGFGTFEAAVRAARTARNPRTGEALEVAATTVARFHPGAGLRARVAAGTGEPLGTVADLTSLQGLAAVEAPSPTTAAPALGKAKAPSASAAKATATTKSKATATTKSKAKAEAKKADVKKRADAAKKADAKKRADAKRAAAKKGSKKPAKKPSGKGGTKKK
jgi:DNA-binding protein HU-beta